MKKELSKVVILSLIFAFILFGCSYERGISSSKSYLNSSDNSTMAIISTASQTQYSESTEGINNVVDSNEKIIKVGWYFRYYDQIEAGIFDSSYIDIYLVVNSDKEDKYLIGSYRDDYLSNEELLELPDEAKWACSIGNTEFGYQFYISQPKDDCLTIKCSAVGEGLDDASMPEYKLIKQIQIPTKSKVEYVENNDNRKDMKPINCYDCSGVFDMIVLSPKDGVDRLFEFWGKDEYEINTGLDESKTYEQYEYRYPKENSSVIVKIGKTADTYEYKIIKFDLTECGTTRGIYKYSTYDKIIELYGKPTEEILYEDGNLVCKYIRRDGFDLVLQFDLNDEKLVRHIEAYNFE